MTKRHNPNIQTTQNKDTSSSANVKGEVVILMEIKNNVEPGLKLYEKGSNGRAGAIKNSFVPLLPNYIDCNGKRDTSHSAFSTTATFTKVSNITVQSRHISSDMQPLLNPTPEKGSPVAAKEEVAM